MKASQLGTLIAIIGGDSGPQSVPQFFMKQIYSTNDADPNVAAIVPLNLTIANIWYQDPATGTGTNLWSWSITNQNWSQISA